MWKIAFLGLPQLTTIPALVAGRPWQLAEAAASAGDGPAPPAHVSRFIRVIYKKILEEVPSELQSQPVR